MAASNKSRGGGSAAKIDWLTLAVLIACLALAAVALQTAISASARARAMEESHNLATDNLGRAIEQQSAYRRLAEGPRP